LYVPKELFDQTGSVVLSVSVNGVPLPDATYNAPGLYVYRAAVRRSSGSGSAVVDCSLSHALTSFGVDERELGVIVHSLEML
jgi:hypothetical protein